MATKEEKFKRHLSSFLGGQNVDAMVATLADAQDNLTNLSIAVTDQLTISTASSIYLDKRLADKGITRPPELGMSDISYRKLGIQITATKKLTELIHNVLETFYGFQAVRANITSNMPEPYQLQDGMTLTIALEDGIERTLTFNISDFRNINQATAAEVADVITRFVRTQGLNGFAQTVTDLDTGETRVQAFGGAKGPYSTISVRGGEAQLYLQFPQTRSTTQVLNDTVWQVTRTVGSTLRFRWIGNTQPNLIQVLPGDRVLLYGAGFKTEELDGTYEITNVRPPQSGPALDAGWFEISKLEFSKLRAVPPDTSPPANSPPTYYSIDVPTATGKDVFFFRPVKAVANNQPRYALAWEPRRDLLKIYMPATTDVVSRELAGASHLHALFDVDNLNGAHGSATVDKDRIEIVSDRVIRYRQLGYDNSATGGTLTWQADELSIPMDNFTHYLPFGTFHVVTYTDTQTQTGLNFTITDCKIGTRIYVRNPTSGIVLVNGNGGTGIPGAHIVPANSNRVIVVNDPSDNNGYTLEADFTALFATSGTIAIDYVERENFVTTIYCAEPHNMVGNPDSVGRTMGYQIVNVTISVTAKDDPINTFPGPYIVDPEVHYTIRSENCVSRDKVFAGQVISTISVDGALPNAPGILLFDLGQDTEEGPVPYIGTQSVNSVVPVVLASISQNGFNVTVTTTLPHGVIVGSMVQISGTTYFDGLYTVQTVPTATSYTMVSGISQVQAQFGVGTSTVVVDNVRSIILVDQSYVFKHNHLQGADITLMSSKTAYEPALDGTDYPVFITGVADGRVFAQEIIEEVTALGIKLEIIIVYPDDIGLGNEGGSSDEDNPPTSEKVEVWGI